MCKFSSRSIAHDMATMVLPNAIHTIAKMKSARAEGFSSMTILPPPRGAEEKPRSRGGVTPLLDADRRGRDLGHARRFQHRRVGNDRRPHHVACRLSHR